MKNVAYDKNVNTGTYIATAAGLTGEDAGWYKLPTENSYVYKIIPALETVTVTPIPRLPPSTA